MPASFYFVVLLLVSFAVAEEESVYVCGVTGSDTNPCLQDSPCSTISKALASTNQTATSIMLNVCAGTYTGESNINITLPSIPITITKYAEPATQETDVIFDCEQNYPTGFTASNAVSFYTITIQSCSFGIQFIAQSDSQIITLQDTMINNCPVGVFVQGTNTSASVYQSSFLDSSVYISKASNIYFSGCAFQGVGAEYSILFESPEIELITLDSISFLDTSGIQAAVGPTTTASVSNCQFQGITSDIFTITGGDWWISQAEISASTLCDTAILFQDINNSNTTGLTVIDSSINSCNSAIFFDAKAQITILSTSINVPNKCIQITKATVVQIGGQTEADIGGITLETCLGIEIYYTQEPIFVNIFGVDFSDTFSMNITVASGSNSNWMYSTITESSAFVLNGGNWTLYSINMVGYYPNFRSNGSMLYLDSSDSSLGIPSVSIRNSNLTGGYTSYFGGCIYATNVNLIVDSTNFENCTAESGGALYANSFEELIVTNCTFYTNAALGNGGAVALESSSNEGIDGNFAGCLFSGNSAPTGSAISCCTSNSDCDITVVYVDDNPVTFEDNENTDASGDTVTCKTVTKGVSSFYDDNGDSDSGIPDYWVYWIILGGMILLVTLGIIITVTVMVIYKKRMSYESIE